MSTDADLGKREEHKVQAYIDARAEVDRLTKALNKAKEWVEKCEAAVLDLYVENGWQNVKCNGRTVSLVKSTYARCAPGEREALLAALRSEGFGDLVKVDVNPSTLAALVREHRAENNPLPESIAQHLIVAEVFSVSMRKS